MRSTVISPTSRITMVLLFSLSWSLASATEFVRPRPLTEYEDILLAQELYTAINAFNDRVTPCVSAGTSELSECSCRYPAEASAAKAVYERVLQARPKWTGKILYWKNPESLVSHNLVMPAINQQLQSSNARCSLIDIPK